MRTRRWRAVTGALAVATLTAGCTTIDRVNTTASGGQSATGASAVAVSRSGRYVAFQSAATDLIPLGRVRNTESVQRLVPPASACAVARPIETGGWMP